MLIIPLTGVLLPHVLGHCSVWSCSWTYIPTGHAQLYW